MSTQTSGEENMNIETANIKMLTNDQQDALGEIGNICMGTCATTLSTLLGKRVNITTPVVSVSNRSEIYDQYERPIMVAEVSFVEGFIGNNVLILKKDDALLIANLLMGAENLEADIESDELFHSVISEIMNQMVGSSSTAMADILEAPVNISPPFIKEFPTEDVDLDIDDEPAIVTSFHMEIEDMLVSNIVQIMSFDFGRRLVNSLMHIEEEPPAPQPEPQPERKAEAPVTPTPVQAPAPSPVQVRTEVQEEKKVDIKAVKYQSFSESSVAETPISMGESSNMDLIVDVPLQVTVVLGKSKKSIKDILSMSMGSVIVLDRLAGEKVDVLVNGKLFAHGEVVVIDDNYGVRITDIVSAKV